MESLQEPWNPYRNPEGSLKQAQELKLQEHLGLPRLEFWKLRGGLWSKVMCGLGFVFLGGGGLGL